ncbi:MAG: hypothetical protein H6598_06480 [Flavobacteriales bacterium]|nr:hypothetical protein [Flavobacteriales bacterium]
MKLYYTTLFLSSLVAVSSCKKEEDPPVEDDGRTPANLTVNLEKAWGTSLEDDFSGAVLDPSNNIIFAGSTLPDGYQGNIIAVKTDGNTVSWAKSFDSGDQDLQPSPSENGHSQGGGFGRTIDVDGSGNTYYTGASKDGFFEAFIMKLDPSGNILWQTFWEVNSTGVASGEAIAYALDESNGKVFVTGAGSGSLFLLVIDGATGAVLTETSQSIDASPTYNDRGYVVRSVNGTDVYIAGWEGATNSGLLMKFSNSGATFDWMNKIYIGYANRFVDMDFDASGNIYLAADIRGVSTALGVVKCNASGNVQWAKKFYGLNNDRNNISCVRVINNVLYVGGRGSFDNYDTGQFGDGVILKVSLAGGLESVYNFFDDNDVNDQVGERFETILHDGSSFIIAGEAWPKYSSIAGKWYTPSERTWENMTGVTESMSTSITINTGDGTTSSNTFTVTSLTDQMYNPTGDSKGSSDIRIFKISSL